MDQKVKLSLKKLDQLRKNLALAEKNAAKDMMSILKKTIRENPALVAFKWQQYTPHFSDGETCIFDVYGPYFKFDESVVPSSENSYDEGFVDGYYVQDVLEKHSDIINHENIKVLKKAVKEVTEAFEHLVKMDKELADMFGDGVEVTVTKDGLQVEEYDHD